MVFSGSPAACLIASAHRRHKEAERPTKSFDDSEWDFEYLKPYVEKLFEYVLTQAGITTKYKFYPDYSCLVYRLIIYKPGVNECACILNLSRLLARLIIMGEVDYAKTLVDQAKYDYERLLTKTI